MSKVSLHFHAVAEELGAWGVEWSREHQLHMVLERFFPERRCATVDGIDIERAIDDLGGIWNRLWLSPEPLTIAPASDPPFAGQPECLALVAGNLTDEGLRASAIGATTEDARMLRTWREIIKSAKTKMLRGAWVMNPVTGARLPAREHLFSEGALAMSHSGTKMLAFAGWNQYAFDPQR